MTVRANKPTSVTFGLPEAGPKSQALLKARIEAALSDPRPSIPAADVECHLEERHEARLRRGA